METRRIVVYASDERRAETRARRAFTMIGFRTVRILETVHRGGKNFDVQAELEPQRYVGKHYVYEGGVRVARVRIRPTPAEHPDGDLPGRAS